MSTLNFEFAKALGEKLAADVSVENGSAVIGSENYYGNLPEGISKEAADTVNEYNVAYGSAVGVATGIVGGNLFKEDESVQSLSISAAVPSGLVSHTVHKEYTIDDQVHANYLQSAYEVIPSNIEEDQIALLQEFVANV